MSNVVSRLWLGLWCVLAVLHLTQAVWTSRGEAVPGDLLDGRFNNLVLEHGWQSLLGRQQWLSPGQYHPREYTLGWSDTHAGTLPFYALARALGAPVERAFQAWFVVVAALNTWAAMRLLGTLRTPDPLTGPLVFLVVAPAALVSFVAPHAQMLPLFAGFAAIDQSIRWAHDRSRARLPAIAGWIAWQFAAAPYLAFFVVLALAIAAVFAFWMRPAHGGATTPDYVEPAHAPSPFAAWAIAAVGLAIGSAAAAAYVTALGSGYERPVAELRLLAPDWRAWFTAPPVSVWYADGASGGPHLFSGAWPWIASLVALGWGWTRRNRPEGRTAFAAAATALAVALLFTRVYSDSGFTLLAGLFEPLRAFRASGRSVLVVHLAQCMAAAFVLGALWRTCARPFVHPMLLALAVFGALETLAWRQPATPVASARARTDAVVAAWRAAGDRPILAFAPGFTNQPDQLAQLDAWSAALRLGRTTINGYSGDAPGSHLAFVFTPSIENARALVAAQGIVYEDVSFVEAWSEPWASALDIRRVETRPVSHLRGFALQPIEWTLFAEMESFEIDGTIAHQFHPPSTVRFRVPDGVSSVTVKQGLRPDAYLGAEGSDGVEVVWTSEAADGTSTELRRTLVDPRSDVAHRGLVPVQLALPSGNGRTLRLDTGYGPAGDGARDWIVFADLQVR
ncbi:hypothetical protein ASA1KI_10790 [Opitutales bacterium ASA1]|uniref:hypothetical protein n=1 Tax=Congregicoccus parvus TaxID=3081749 RepID=UPI002B2EEA6C|nr:hypothetical protein ASA1KI_10790 [Opitutales bacterium ASA1]